MVAGVPQSVRRIDEPFLDGAIPLQADVFGDVQVVRSSVAESDFALRWRSLVALRSNGQGFVHPIFCLLQGFTSCAPFIVERIDHPHHFGRTAPT